MTNTKQNLRNVFSKNRAEELGYDVWESFVVPRFYDRLDIGAVRKPQVFIGGRGCGKTMLLRYFCHHSVFSKKRLEISSDAIGHIGLYWRADTQFASAMANRGVPQDVWADAFRHMAALVLSAELLESLHSIAFSACKALVESDIADIKFTKLTAFDADIPESATQFVEYIRQRIWSFESWVSNVRTAPQPRFLPGERFLKAIIGELRRQLPAFSESGFVVYLDEYENLASYQRDIINTWLKHSEAPLIFNLAMK